MNASAKNFTAYLDQKQLKYDVKEREDDVSVSINIKMDNASFRVTLFIDDDNTHVAIRCFGIVNVPQNKLGGALIACNKCNNDYRWVKFVIDDDMDLNAYDDAVISPESAGEELYELMVRMLGIADECYPVFMKSVWG